MVPSPPRPARALRCPFPECDGVVDEAALRGDRTVVCPKCRRLSARCSRLHHDGQCPALNRPMAQFCRYCKQVLSPGWAEEQWDWDVGREAEARSLVLTEAETVLEVDGWLEPDPHRARPVELAHAGGWLWLGCSDGRSLFVEPFADRVARPSVPRFQLWPRAVGLRMQSRCDGPWLVVWSDRGIQLFNLLSLDDPHGDPRPQPLWGPPGPDARLAAAPIYVRRPESDDPLSRSDRILVWLVQGARGELILHVSRLGLGASPQTANRVLQPPGEAVLGLEDEEQALLLPAAFGRRERVLLCTRQEIWLLDVAGPGGDGKLSGTPLLHNVPKLRGRRVLTGRPGSGLPGAVFVPGDAEDPRAEPRGELFFCYRADEGERLCALTIAPGTRPVPLVYEHPAVPVQSLDLSRIREVLCVDGDRLMLCTRLAMQRSGGQSPYLSDAARVAARGRLALCSGSHNPGGGRNLTFSLLMDLHKQAIVWSEATGRSAAQPVLVGPYLFALELRDTPGQPYQSLVLTRRRVVPQADDIL
jgi:hypothetical protein